MKYSSEKAEEYWSQRVNTVDELRAVLSYDFPEYVNRSYHAWETGLMLEELGNIEGKSVMDLGCGVGRLTELLASRGAIVTSVDNSREMLNRAAAKVEALKKTEQVKIVKGSAHSVPVPDENFDAIVCFGLLEHLPADVREAALKEMMRLVKADGTILLVVHNDKNLFFGNVDRYKMHEQQDNGYFVRPMDLSSIEGLFNASGFVLEVIGNDFMYSFVRQSVDRMTDIEIGENNLKTLFQFCAQFDLENRMDKTLVESMSDHLMIKVGCEV